MRLTGLITSMIIYFSAYAGNGSFENQENPVVTYIGKYKKIAQSEMQRVGIPASIKLAQGIVESNSGRSTLARKAYNHFGIKCGKYWKGKNFYREDDDYKNGKLIASCFRKFNSPDHSYIAHSDFLTNPGSQYRYGFLFDFDPQDYINWAIGLKSSGYATDPKYANKLISIIEKYELYKYDVITEHNKADELLLADNNIDERKTQTKEKARRTHSIPFEIETQYYLVKNGDSMQKVADEHNIDIDFLYFQNRMPIHSQPRIGEKIKIDGIINWGERRPKTKKNFSQSKESYLFEDGSMTITIR